MSLGHETEQVEFKKFTLSSKRAQCPSLPS